MKIIYKIVLVIALISAAIWSYNWYTGKFAPSLPDAPTTKSDSAIAYFAGGCFWCTESDFEKVPGVNEVVSGYMGGSIDTPSYNQVTKGDSGHREMVKVDYDPSKVSYRHLVLELMRETDPTDSGGSFYDRGFQYTSAIYYQNEDEKQIAEEVIQELEELNIFDQPIVTSIEPSNTFWVAEKYHQNFYKNSSVRYKHYRKGSGRDDFIESIWGSGKYDYLFENSQLKTSSQWENFQKPDDETLKEMLTPLQYRITQEEGTETPFENEYWDNHEDGIYVDIISGEPLFSSTVKFDSGTGWPSFLRPLDLDFVTEIDDYQLVLRRTEIRSKYADSHLGHIILDGPTSNNKIRYCMNSAALHFITKDDLEAEGLGQYLPLFDSTTSH